MSRDIAPRLQALLQAFRRFTGAPGTAEGSLDRPHESFLRKRRVAGDFAVTDREATMATTPVSVVVANCSSPESIARCLAAVLAQRFDPKSFEVIVVDDSAGGDVHAVVEALTPVCGAPQVRHLRIDGGGPLAALNHGWRAAKGVLVAFTDEKALPDPEWLACGERAMRAGHEALCGSICVPASKPLTAAQLAELQHTSAFVRRDALERVGGFDERCAMV